jgi:hypothetical protein
MGRFRTKKTNTSFCAAGSKSANVSLNSEEGLMPYDTLLYIVIGATIVFVVLWSLPRSKGGPPGES